MTVVTAEGFREVPLDIAVELDSAGRSVDVEREVIDEEAIEDPFDPEQIDVTTRTPTVGLLLSRIERGVLDLQPDFQRLAGIWTHRAQSRLIESMLLRIPLPTFYAAESPDSKDDRWVVVDGIQRLTSIARFVSPANIGREPLVLKGLEYLVDFEGLRFDELPGGLKTRLLETEVVVHLIRRGTPEPAMFNIFARINTGGRPLSRQELRHALIPGPARIFLKNLAESEEYRQATAGSVSPERMDDREMVLRFIAFYLSEPARYTRQDFDVFLRDAMRNLNQLDAKDVAQLESEFKRVMKAAFMIFGEHAFRKRYRGQVRRSPVNKALFEAVAVNIARRSDEEISALCDRRPEVLRAFSAMLEDRNFERAISQGTGDPGKVRLRFTEIDGTLRGIIRD